MDADRQVPSYAVLYTILSFVAVTVTRLANDHRLLVTIGVDACVTGSPSIYQE